MVFLFVFRELPKCYQNISQEGDTLVCFSSATKLQSHAHVRTKCTRDMHGTHTSLPPRKRSPTELKKIHTDYESPDPPSTCSCTNYQQRAHGHTLKSPRGIRIPNTAARAQEIRMGSSIDPKGIAAVRISEAFRNVEKARASYMLVWVSSNRSKARSDSSTRTCKTVRHVSFEYIQK